MLQITIPGTEAWDEINEEFIVTKEQTITLEHSLISISKWESKWRKPFLVDTGKTTEETIDYIKCMTITLNVDPKVYNLLLPEHIQAIQEYIANPMTATWFREDETKGRANRKVITNELIYCWMVQLQIPFECEKWHINRLLTLIRVCSEENKPQKSMNKRDAANHYKSLNAARKKRLGTKG